MCFVGIEEWLNLREVFDRKARVVHHEEEVGGFTRKSAAWQGLLASEESLKRIPVHHLRVIKRDLHAINERLLKFKLLRLQDFEFSENRCKCALDFTINSSRCCFLLHLRGGLLHARTEEIAALIIGHLAVLFGDAHVFAHLFHASGHLLLALRRHERFHELTANIHHRALHALHLRLVRSLVVFEQLLDNVALNFVKRQLSDEELKVATRKVWFECVANIAHSCAAATATTATATATATKHATEARHAALTLSASAACVIALLTTRILLTRRCCWRCWRSLCEEGSCEKDSCGCCESGA